MDLCVAAGCGDTRKVRRLVQHGANVDGGGGANGPLHFAANHGHASTAQALLELGAAVDGCDPGGTPLHCAAEHNHAAVAGVLLAAGADVHATDDGREQTPLQWAEQGGQHAVARLLRQCEPKSPPAAQTKKVFGASRGGVNPPGVAL